MIAAAVIIAGMKPVLAIACLLAVAVGTSAAANPALWRLAGWKTDFNKHTVPLDEILPGGPPRDGIPPIDRPLFKPANDVTGIAAREPVIVYPLDADARASLVRMADGDGRASLTLAEEVWRAARAAVRQVA